MVTPLGCGGSLSNFSQQPQGQSPLSPLPCSPDPWSPLPALGVGWGTGPVSRGDTHRGREWGRDPQAGGDGRTDGRAAAPAGRQAGGGGTAGWTWAGEFPLNYRGETPHSRCFPPGGRVPRPAYRRLPPPLVPPPLPSLHHLGPRCPRPALCPSYCS